MIKCFSLFRKETLSTESLERERKIAKETLRLEAIRKEVLSLNLISLEAGARGKQTDQKRYKTKITCTLLYIWFKMLVK